MQKKFPFIVTSLAALACFAPHDSESRDIATWVEWLPIEGGYFSPEAKDFAITPKFDRTFPFDIHGYAKVALNGKYGVINTSGESILPLDFNQIWDFCYYAPEGYALVERQGKRGFINTKGEVVIPIEFDDADGFDVYGKAVLARVERDGRIDYINTQGESIFPMPLDYVGHFNAHGDEIMSAYGNIHYNKSSDYCIRGGWPVRQNDLVKVAKNNKYGLINPQGEIVVPLQFDEIDHFEDNGLAQVRQGEKYGLINIHGEIIAPVQFDSIDYFGDDLFAQFQQNDETCLLYTSPSPRD